MNNIKDLEEELELLLQQYPHMTSEHIVAKSAILQAKAAVFMTKALANPEITKQRLFEEETASIVAAMCAELKKLKD